MSKKLRLDDLQQPSTSSSSSSFLGEYNNSGRSATPSPINNASGGVFGGSGSGGFSMSVGGTPYKGKYTRSLLGSAGPSSLSRFNPYSVRDRTTAGRRSVPLIRAKRDDTNGIVPTMLNNSNNNSFSTSSTRATLSPGRPPFSNTSSTAQKIMEKLANMSTPVLNAGRVRLDSISSIKPLQIGSTLLSSSAVMTPTSKFAGPPKAFSPFSVPKTPVGVRDPIDWSLKLSSGNSSIRSSSKLVDCGTNTDDGMVYSRNSNYNSVNSPRSSSTALVLSSKSNDILWGSNVIVANGGFSFSSPWPLTEIDEYVGQEINKKWNNNNNQRELRAIEAPPPKAMNNNNNNNDKGRTEDKVTLTNGGMTKTTPPDVNNSFLKLPTTPPIISPKKKWECSECWVSNNPGDTKCICCGASKPGPPGGGTNNSNSNSSSSSGSAKSPSVQNTDVTTKPLLWKSPNVSTWECSECWVSNNSKDTNCVCCGSSKPGGVAKTVDNTDGQNKTHSVLTSTSSTTPKRKSESISEESSNKKLSFGQTSSSVPLPSSASAFKFGLQSTTTTPDSKSVSSDIKPEVNSTSDKKPLTTGFQFGAQPTTTTSTTNPSPAFGFGFGSGASSTPQPTKTVSTSASTFIGTGNPLAGASSTGTTGFGSLANTSSTPQSTTTTTSTPSFGFSSTANSTSSSLAVVSPKPSVTPSPSFGAATSQPFTFGTPSSSENQKSGAQNNEASKTVFNTSSVTTPQAPAPATQNFSFGSPSSTPLKASIASTVPAPANPPTPTSNPNFMEALKNASAAVKASSEKQPASIAGGFQAPAAAPPTQSASSGGIFGSAPSSSTIGGFGFGSAASNTSEPAKPANTGSVFQNLSTSTSSSGAFGSPAPFGSGSTFTGTGNPLAGASSGGFGSSTASDNNTSLTSQSNTTANTSGFGFGNNNTASSGSSWINPAPSSTPAPAPSFGSPAPAPASTNQPFAFGGTPVGSRRKADNSNDDNNISSKKFAFGENPSASSTPQASFGFGSPAPLNPTPMANDVNFLDVLKNTSAAAAAAAKDKPASGGFQFGAGAAQPASGGGIFGAAAPQNPPAFGFGSNTNNNTGNNSSFGSPMPNSNAGVMNPNPGNLAFGMPPTAAAVTPAPSQFSLTPNFNFGAQAPSTPNASFNFGANPPAGAQAGQTQPQLFQFSSRSTPAGNQPAEPRKIMKATRRFRR